MNKNETGGWVLSPDFRIISYTDTTPDATFLASLLRYFPGGLAGFRGIGGELLFLTQGVTKLLEISEDSLKPGTHFSFHTGRSIHADPALGAEVQRQIDETGRFRLNISLECPDKGLIRISLDGGPTVHPDYGPCILCFFSDITGCDREVFRLIDGDLHDAESGLRSQRYFKESCISYLKNDGQDSTHAYFIINIDNFRQANTALGKDAVDELLSMTGSLLTRAFRDNDILGRVADDKFSILMKDVPSLYIVEERATTICQMLRQLFLEFEFPPGTCSIGGVYGRLSQMTTEEIFEHADHALYRAKTQGNGHWDIYAGDGKLSVHSMSKKR